jgi:hypothetical protein
MLDFLGGGWGWKNLGDVGSVVCMLPKLRSRALCAREPLVRADTATRVPHNSRLVRLL